ncbi:MAG: hypothetical protein JRJ03_09980 [Deltaproteobacteria bacterium]|nr:hypothetical protein [Deltaproteobacteria bacterium]
MSGVVLQFSDEEIMQIEAILMDGDAESALRFLREVLRPKIRAKGSRNLDPGKPSGIMT